MAQTDKLENKHCVPCEGGVPPLDGTTVIEFLKQLERNWKVTPEYKQIYHDFHFENYDQTIAFVNAIAAMANQENPGLQRLVDVCPNAPKKIAGVMSFT